MIQAKVEDYIVDIKGKKYMMVAGRLIEAHRDAKESLSIKTEIHEIQENAVIFKATVEIDGKEFTGHAVSNFNAQGVEGGSPFEVAETSAVGRALGFAGFGLVGGIATAEEVMHAQNREGVVTGFHGSKDPKYQEVFKRVVQATNYNDINEIVESEDFKGLEVEEKRGILKRIQSFKTASNGNKEDTKPKT